MRTDILERKEEILQWIAEEQPKSYMCKQLGCKQETLNSYLKKMGIEYAGQQAKKGQFKGSNVYRPAQYYIENNLPIQSHKLKEKLFRDESKTIIMILLNLIPLHNYIPTGTSKVISDFIQLFPQTFYSKHFPC